MLLHLDAIFCVFSQGILRFITKHFAIKCKRLHLNKISNAFKVRQHVPQFLYNLFQELLVIYYSILTSFLAKKILKPISVKNAKCLIQILQLYFCKKK